MTIIFPMAGLSSRFFKAGYTLPKYMLKINENSLFFEVLNGFSKYFKEHKFLFICKNIFDTPDFIKQECKKLQLKNYAIKVLEKDTDGQAHTVFLGFENIADNEEILIFNIDTIRPNFALPNGEFLQNCDGYLEVFNADGNHWSFVKSNDETNVIKTAEKERISDLASTGLYYFKKSSDFKNIFLNAQKNTKTTKGEYFIAPLYNDLISQNKTIKYYRINKDEIVLCGTPSEYENLKKKNKK